MDLYDFCRAATDQLRCKWEAEAVYQELADHIHDHADALAHQGVEAREAEHAAVDAMGDPVALGKALDRLHSPWPWRVLHFCTTGLALALIVLLFCGAVWLLQDEWEREAPLFSSLTAEEVQAALSRDEGTTLRTGQVQGGGRVGDYTLSPMGEALLQRIAPWYYEGTLARPEHTELVFAVATSHVQPWLGDFQDDWYMLSAVDDQGNAYDTVALYGLESGRLTGRHVLSVYYVPETARQITVTLSTDRGTVRFTVDLGEGGQAP